MKKTNYLIIITLGISVSAFAQTPLTTFNGVKTNTSQYLGDLNNNQNWGGNGHAGMYMFNAQTTTNAPIASDWYHVIEMQHDSNNTWTGQIAMSYFTDALFYRQQNGYVFGNWHTIASQDWVQSQLISSRLKAVGNGMSKDAFDTNSDFIIQANTGGRSGVQGAQLEFVIPAGTDGGNLWGQGRIITVAGNSNNGDATGKMILGTRRMFNKVGTGNLWYYGDDLTIDGAGNVGIGTITPAEKLAVNGIIRSKEIKVETANWPDYVFDHDYKILGLQELESYIRANKHLPEIPPAKEVEANGVALGEMNKLLLKKVEELTLHLIDKDKKMELQQKQLDQIESTLKQLIKNK